LIKRRSTYVERRDFMKFLVLTSLAFTVDSSDCRAELVAERRGRPEPAGGGVDDLPIGGV
jgi:hypothetical protein